MQYQRDRSKDTRFSQVFDSEIYTPRFNAADHFSREMNGSDNFQDDCDRDKDEFLQNSIYLRPYDDRIQYQDDQRKDNCFNQVAESRPRLGGRLGWTSRVTLAAAATAA